VLQLNPNDASILEPIELGYRQPSGYRTQPVAMRCLFKQQGLYCSVPEVAFEIAQRVLQRLEAVEQE
jgi:hypothetical protein